MAKTKTFEQRAKSSRRTVGKSFDPNDFSPVVFKDGTRLEKYDPKIRLRNKKLIGAALFEALMEGDAEAFKEILRAHLETVNKELVSTKSGVSRSTVFRMLEPGSNPTLNNVVKLFRVLKLT